jgi:hypothetical protein
MQVCVLLTKFPKKRVKFFNAGSTYIQLLRDCISIENGGNPDLQPMFIIQVIYGVATGVINLKTNLESVDSYVCLLSQILNGSGNVPYMVSIIPGTLNAVVSWTANSVSINHILFCLTP